MSVPSLGKGRGGRGAENDTTSALRRALCAESSSGNQQGWWGLVSPRATPKPGLALSAPEKSAPREHLD